MTDHRHDIEKYLNGELTPAERNALERKALHDPFLADALQGAEQINVTEFLKDVAALNERITKRKSVSVWMWPARIAAGLVIILVSSYIVWTFINPEPVQDLAFEKSESTVTPLTPVDSANPTTGILSSPSVEQPSSGPSMRDKDVATRSTYPSKVDAKPKQGSGEPVLKNEPVTDALVTGAEQAKAEEIITEEIKVAESLAQAKATEKEAELARAKDENDYVERKKLAKSTDKKKTLSADSQDAPAAAYKSGEGFASLNVIRGQVTSVEDGSPLPGVNVVIKNSTIGTATDAQGNYQLTVNDSNPTLAYSFIGLKSTEVKADKQEVNVQMSLDDTQLSEVVVTGSGIQSAGETVPPTVDLAHPEIGNRAFKQYLEKTLRYPKQAKENKVEGRVTVQFTVEVNGTLTNFIILRGIGSGCDEELIRLIKEGSKWIPTKKDGVAVQDKAKVRLKFELPK